MTTLQQFALEAAQSATAAFGIGHEPQARIAFEFMVQTWGDDEEQLLDEIPEEMPVEFELWYDRAIHDETVTA